MINAIGNGQLGAFQSVGLEVVSQHASRNIKNENDIPARTVDSCFFHIPGRSGDADNDADDTSIVGGLVADMEYNEYMYYAKYESRFGDNIKVECDYYYIEPSKKVQTAYALLGRHQRIGLNIAYYF